HQAEHVEDAIGFELIEARVERLRRGDRQVGRDLHLAIADLPDRVVLAEELVGALAPLPEDVLRVYDDEALAGELTDDREDRDRLAGPGGRLVDPLLVVEDRPLSRNLPPAQIH